VFVDIEPDSLTIDPAKIEAVINKNTRAIMPVHVFGIPAKIEEITVIAKKHNIKVIYDGAHAFGNEYGGKSLLDYGDITMASFHATKPFHTIEGGGILTRNKVLSDRIELMKRFGHNGDEHYMLGINAKVSEFNAAMGLCNLTHINNITTARRTTTELYDKLLGDRFQKPSIPVGLKRNYAYYPVIFESEKALLGAKVNLEAEEIFPRRYFFPSLNTLPYVPEAYACPISEDISKRILCLPLYAGLEASKVREICEIITK
jgi:dTDP-4-amino-4,6-dideoxygalactose transaminase